MSFGDPSWRPWVLPEDKSREIIRAALEMGINFFDVADVYSEGVCEEIVGKALRDFSQRDEVVIGTKVYFPVGPGSNQRGLSRVHIMRAIDNSLRRLGTDHVDLYQIHRWDEATPIAETLEALHDLVKVGKVRYLGASGLRAWQFSEALHTAERRGWTRFISMQNHYNLIYREDEREMLPLCRVRGIGIIPWSPLARGVLARKRTTGPPVGTHRARSDDRVGSMYGNDGDSKIVDQVAHIAGQRGTSPATIALAWLLQNPQVVSPIVGATRVSHISDAVSAIELRLTDEDVARLEEPYVAHELLVY